MFDKKVASKQEMGVFKWFRRERVTVSAGHVSPSTAAEEPPAPVGTIRTEEYKRDLAEFQARRSSGGRELQTTPIRKKCGRHSLPVSCTNCTGDPDNTFNYEKKSAIKYKKKLHKCARNVQSEEEDYDGVPNVQFLFQNQVFMPGNMFGMSYSEPRRTSKSSIKRSPDFCVQKQIDFEDNQTTSPPFFYKNNSLPFDAKRFLDGERREDDEVDGLDAAGDVHTSSPSSGSQKNDSCKEELWEVMSELRHFDQWADVQLQASSNNNSKSDDSKSDTSTFGLPIASASNLNVTLDKAKMWSHGRWGVVPVQIKKLAGVTIENVKKKKNMEINILRKCRHPNVILLMGLYPDVQNNIHIICERCIDTLFGLLHVQGRILSAQTSIHYALDIANALVFLRMHEYLHTELSSMSVVVTAQDTAKLADLGGCVKMSQKKEKEKEMKHYDVYSPEPVYVNITDTRDATSEFEPLLSQRSSEAYLNANAVSKHYKAYSESEHYRWQAPELFAPDEDGLVYLCSKSDVYSLCVIIWECCNATLPFKSQSYDKLKLLYLQNVGINLPQDGTYPGSLLSLLQRGLALKRDHRMDLASLQTTLLSVKRNLDEIEYIVIPARLTKRKSSTFDTLSSPTDSECVSPKNMEHKVIIHNRDTVDDNQKERNSESPLYETIRKTRLVTSYTTEKCFMSDDEDLTPPNFNNIQEKNSLSAYSTPMTKLRARMKDIETPGTLYKSDSTEYCSILSPDTRLNNFAFNDESNKEQSAERPTAKLSRSFTPKSYKPLHIKVPAFNLDSIKTIIKEKDDKERSSYNFDIKNYSLPTTPIARSNKLRKNAWLSGELNVCKSNPSKSSSLAPSSEDTDTKRSDTVILSSTNPSLEKEDKSEDLLSNQERNETLFDVSSVGTIRNSYTGLRRVSDPPADYTDLEVEPQLERAHSLNCMKSSLNMKLDDALASVNVKPLVAIHEKWIYEANKKNVRLLSLPEDNRGQGAAVKPASHCVDARQQSLPHLASQRSHRSGHWEQYCQARGAISKSLNFHPQDATWRKASEKETLTEDIVVKTKIDQSTDTLSIEEFIRDLIRKEFEHLVEIADNTSDSTHSLQKSEDYLNKGVANIMGSLKNGEQSDNTAKKDPLKSFSRVKINGNDKPLLQITFNRSGEKSLQVLDNSVNVTICDSNGGKEKLNISVEDTLSGEDLHINSLKRCQAFSAIQEARSTEDLYIDDDLSTMQDNFGGKVKLIPLHGSLHEILCEKEDDCCLIKVKQENGCDTIYFRCDNSDTESRDAVDSTDRPKDTVVFKRSISLIEERIQRIFPKEKRPNPVTTLKRFNEKLRARPKSEIFIKSINKDTRVLSNSSPSLVMKDDKDEVELNIENVMCYQDSSSDDECLKCQTDDDFEELERKIEQDLANTLTPLTCGCLEKISEENLSTLTDDVDKY